MSLLDAFIIYLALGAPVAMYRFFQLSRPVTLVFTVRVLIALLLWPIEAVKILLASHRIEADASIFDTRQSLDVRIIERVNYLKSILIADHFPGQNGAVYSSGAEAIERYVGISIAAYGQPRTLSGTELLSIAGHPDAVVGATCLARKHQRRLREHLKAAAHDAVESVISARTDILERPQSIDVLRAIAEEFGDNATIRELDTLIAAENGTVTSVEKKRWIPERESEQALS